MFRRIRPQAFHCRAAPAMGGNLHTWAAQAAFLFGAACWGMQSRGTEMAYFNIGGRPSWKNTEIAASD